MNKLYIIRGDSTTIETTFTNDDGSVIDLTGATVYFTVKKKQGDVDDDALIKKDVTTHVDAANGVTAIELTASDTDIEVGEHVWDLQIKYVNGNVQSTSAGIVEVSQDITQRTT